MAEKSIRSSLIETQWVCPICSNEILVVVIYISPPTKSNTAALAIYGFYLVFTLHDQITVHVIITKLISPEAECIKYGGKQEEPRWATVTSGQYF